jgi:predicted MFS family arabinose efflux permease
MILLVLPFFLAYAGNEGFFTNFGLYLNGMHVPTDWVGWSAAISTGFGWMLASRIGTWADRSGGKELLLRVLLGYTVMYLVMALAHSQIVVIIAFSLPLYPLLNIGVQRALAESLPGEWHGGAMGLINGSAGLATFGGSIIMGTMITVFGPGGMPWAAVIFVGLGLLLAFVLYRRPRLSGVKNVRG